MTKASAYITTQKRTDWLVVSLATAVFISFFIPLVQIKLFNLLDFISLSGIDIYYHFDRLGIQPILSNYSIIAIPISAIIIFFLEILKSWVSKVFQVICFFVITVLLMELITLPFREFPDLMKFSKIFRYLGIGFYLNLIAGVFFLFNTLLYLFKRN